MQESNKNTEQFKVLDLVFKGLTTLSTGLLVWIFTTVNSMQKDVEVMKNDNKYSQESVKEIKEFAKIPRFTKMDFEEGIKPLIKQLNSNTDLLNDRSSFIRQTQGDIIKLSMTVDELKDKVQQLEIKTKR